MSIIKENNKFIYTKSDYTDILANKDFHMPGWIWAHSTIFRAFELIENKLNSWNPKSVGEISTVVKAIRNVFEFLHQHHHHEDELVFPILKDQSEDIKNLLVKLDEQHVEWDRLQGEVNDIINSLLSIKSVQDQIEDVDRIIRELCLKFSETRHCVVSHFLDEEQTLLPIVVTIPKNKQNDIANHIQTQSRKDRLFKFSVCLINDAAQHDKAVENSFNSEVPWLIRKLVVGLWKKSEYNWFLKALEV
ncbi:hypothetical protein PPL_06247 [Heterostelium album PN500]|uniref:Hemerythrin-like domain-containing protein n=1 Tax=Heterostelium pallidum (strain ATCC 26659 / Pp 5 / PN500) TaxID=670386 RepID=D3BCM2_HETP5|nr:hypothetical protein PPL_06247 [Heterostelium album PN500]EFA80664.1 hypothetical protein PPL_06247 [Heterostelium album PN500]|eukprot:XP_020432784.1 hypothetical protein PPL_06247 [Heterostelium album PN500]